VSGFSLIGPTARAMRWAPTVAAAGLALAIVAVPVVVAERLTADQLATLLRLAAAAVAVGVAFLLDDPAARSLATVPIPRLVRHAVRAGLAVGAAAIVWSAALAVPYLGPTPTPSPAALTLEATALVTVALGLAAAGGRVGSDGNAGVLAAPALLLLLAIVWLAPPRVALVVAPADPQWASAHRRWAALLVLGVVAFVWASRDPTRLSRSPAPAAARGATRRARRAARSRPG